MSRGTTTVVVMGALLASAGSAFAAGWDSQTVKADWLYPDVNSVLESHNVVVGAGVELPASLIINDDKFDIDLGPDTVQFNFNATSNWTAVSFNGWRFSDLNGTIPDIVGYTIDAFSQGIGNVNGIVLSFDANHVKGNFAGMTVAGNGDFIRLKVEFVPAPGGLAVLGLAAIGTLRRRR